LHVGSNVSEELAVSILSIEEDSAVKVEAADFSEALVPRLHTYCTSSLSILGLRLQTLTSVSIVQVAGFLFNDEICVQTGGTKVSYCPACRPAGDNKHLDLAGGVYRPTPSSAGNSMQSARVAGFITLSEATTV
jgi:hypothetical protein